MITKIILLLLILIFKNVSSQEIGKVHLKNGLIKEGNIQILKPFGSSSTSLNEEIISWEDIKKIEIGDKEILPKYTRYNGLTYKSYFVNDEYFFYVLKKYGKNNFSLKKIELTK